MRTLLVVSGGDAPGINAAIAQYAAIASAHGDTVVGALEGFPGVLNGRIGVLTYQLLMPLKGVAGSYLQSSRDPVLAQPNAEQKMKTVLAEHHIDNIVLFGGDGSLRNIPPVLKSWGIPCIGIPTTIDNDVPGTDLSLGFDSACNYAYQTIDGIHATASALPGRMFMVETLGGGCGNIALAVAEGSGAHAVLLPEFEYQDQWLVDRMKSAVGNFGFGLLVLNEFARGARTLAEDLPKLTGIRIRDVRLGHAQRGGHPTHRDRVLGRQMAETAYTSLKNGAQLGTTVVNGVQVLLREGLLPSEPTPQNQALYDQINGLR